MQLFAKFKKILRRGFRAILNFRKFKVALNIIIKVAIPASRGEINRENTAARGEFFFVVTICQCYLPNRMIVNLKRAVVAS